MSNEKYDTAVVGLALAALDGAQMMIESLRKDREHVSTELAAARREIESLQAQAQAQQCGAGAGCCAQAARIEALEEQLEAVGAGGVGPMVRALEIAEAALADIGDADREPWDDVAWCEARAAQAQPVAWALQWPDDSRLNLSTVFDTQLEATDYRESCSDGVVVVPLYTAPQQAAHLAAKWQVVPRQLTQDMADAAKFVDGRLSVFKYADAYRAMLYAAPQPAAQPAPQPAAQPAAQALDALKQVCAIAVSATKTNSRDIADWREDMYRIAAISAQKENHD